MGWAQIVSSLYRYYLHCSSLNKNPSWVNFSVTEKSRKGRGALGEVQHHAQVFLDQLPALTPYPSAGSL